MLIHRAHNHSNPPPRWPADKPKPKLKMAQLPIYRVHYRHLEAYLVEVYRMREFDFFLATGVTPGMAPEYNVVPELPPAWECEQRANKIRAGRRTKDVSLILTVLCIDGFIPAGTYVIDTRKPTPPIDVYRALLQQTRDPLDPKCVKYRETHQSDQEFTKKAAELDHAVIEWLREQQKECDQDSSPQ